MSRTLTVVYMCQNTKISDVCSVFLQGDDFLNASECHHKVLKCKADNSHIQHR